MNGWVSRSQAAQRLGVTERQIGNLVAAGELSQLARGLLDATSVDRYALVARTGTQAWAEATAWAAVALLSDVDPSWIGPSQVSRLRKRLAGLTAERLVERTRGRAVVTRWIAHPSSLPRIAPHVIQPDTVGLGLAATTGQAVDGYVPETGVEALVVTHGLLRGDDGVLTLRATGMTLDVVRQLAAHPTLAALDLSTSLDPRERRAGLTVLDRQLDRRAAADV